jgi:predicted nucleic acid-binding protein
MRKDATFDSSFWVHAVYLDLVDFLLADYALICTEAVAKELGRDNPTSRRLQALLTAMTIQSATPHVEQIILYGEGERAAINLALESNLLLLIDDWRPYEAARAAGVAVVNTLAYLVQLYAQERMTVEHVLSDIGRLARRGTLRPEWIQSALKIVVEMRNREYNDEQGQTP